MIDRNTIASFLAGSLGSPKESYQGLKFNCPKS